MKMVEYTLVRVARVIVSDFGAQWTKYAFK
jgi:hypothetical protein